MFEDEPRAVAAIAQRLLPYALVAPSVTLHRLTRDAVTHSGQVGRGNAPPASLLGVQMQPPA